MARARREFPFGGVARIVTWARGAAAGSRGERGGSGTVAGAAKAEAGGGAEGRILAAALEAFSEKGFEGATTREIATRADVTLGLLQYYFGNKQKLWKAAVDLAFTEMKERLEAVLAGPQLANERERLGVLIHAHVRFAARNPEFIRLMHDEGKRRGPRMRWLVDRHVKPLFDLVVPLIERAQEQGVLAAGIDPAHFVYILVGAAGVIFHQAEECKRVTGIDPTSEAAAEAHARAVVALFLGRPPEESA